jgi:hypothetical protein
MQVPLKFRWGVAGCEIEAIGARFFIHTGIFPVRRCAGVFCVCAQVLMRPRTACFR